MIQGEDTAFAEKDREIHQKGYYDNHLLSVSYELDEICRLTR